MRKQKIFETSEKHYSYGVADNYNIKIKRVSRWIQVKRIMITKKSHFWDYADSYTEENGKRFIDVFRFNDRLYCISQFLRLSAPYSFIDTDGKNSFISGYDCTDYYYPLLIEISENGDYIRLYEELRENEYTEMEG